MRKRESPQNAEFLFADEDFGAVSAQQYRSSTRPVPCFSLLSATLTIHLLPDPGRARFTFECVVEAVGNAGSEEWSYDIPALDSQVSGVQAWDGIGTLATELASCEAKSSRLRVWFRRMVTRDAQYRFWYTYEAPVHGVVCTRVLRRMVVCTGWLIFNLPCETIRVSIHLPERSRLVKCTPSGEVAEQAPGRLAIQHPPDRLRALETSQWLVAYEHRKIGLPLYLWSASQLAAGMVGWFIGRVLDGWASSQ
jgi:hypothetical protein